MSEAVPKTNKEKNLPKSDGWFNQDNWNSIRREYTQVVKYVRPDFVELEKK